MREYKPTIGLEIHAELKTKTKMFCSCKNDPDEKRPNTNICPVCLAHPGTLPTINKEAIKSIIKIGLAVNGKIADFSEFDRKNYFYPDIPKGYQISQYKHPLVSGGEIGGVKLTRIHLEEDTAKSSHSKDGSLVDFNRAGVPLMELVTEPVIHSASEAVRFGMELQKLLQYLNVADANMEKGEMRFEANISVQRSDLENGLKGQILGTKVEIKNLNSFRSAERAIEYEIKRQRNLLDIGLKVNQETRGWDEKAEATFPQRSKEDSHDYRYFPDPDLPKLWINRVDEFNLDLIKGQLPETPAQKRERLSKAYLIKDSDIEFYISNTSLSDLFEKTANILSSSKDFQLLSNYLVSDIAGFGADGLSIKPENLAELIKMLAAGEISSRAAKDILLKMLKSDLSPRKIAEKEKLMQTDDEKGLTEIAEKIVEQNANVAKEFKDGKTSALQYLIGQAMKLSRGSANPLVLKKIFEKILSK